MDAEVARDELATLGREGFLNRHGRYYLVVTDPDQLEAMSLWVQTASRHGHEVARKRVTDRAAFLPIMEQGAHTNGNRYEVGREPPCAVVLSHQRVSKVHAFFQDAGGLLTLTDAGSKNGTRLNGNKLAPHSTAPIDLGDTIEFGAVTAILWGIDDLIAALATL
jgi:hypothetical protein